MPVRARVRRWPRSHRVAAARPLARPPPRPGAGRREPCEAEASVPPAPQRPAAQAQAVGPPSAERSSTRIEMNAGTRTTRGVIRPSAAGEQRQRARRLLVAGAAGLVLGRRGGPCLRRLWSPSSAGRLGLGLRLALGLGLRLGLRAVAPVCVSVVAVGPASSPCRPARRRAPQPASSTASATRRRRSVRAHADGGLSTAPGRSSALEERRPSCSQRGLRLVRRRRFLADRRSFGRRVRVALDRTRTWRRATGRLVASSVSSVLASIDSTSRRRSIV